ncbi:phosphatidate cytidylyltransferase [Paraphaeosphaeria minitans]|uniref:dolichol kinase n=1 Tax=Paraphaeosphaeria minitans TaxID=565426 RepID=A0A9P6G7T6_9PLEO|nr:phosphatidate cytidylyltransferase [Paraphaeosphaeria minitans]
MAQASETPDAQLEPPESQLEAPTTSDTEALELFRRSPHPYHRHQHELRTSQPSSQSSNNDLSRTTRPTSQGTPSEEDEKKRRRVSQSPSESGTEADDEGYGFVKALPAPPLRPHKGLRDARGSGLEGDATPSLTPSQVDEEGLKLSMRYFQPRKEGSRTGEPSPTDDEAKATRQKYLKRRRNEVFRRTTETALLGVIGILAVGGCKCWEKLLQWHRLYLSTHVVVMASVLAIYPLRLLFYSWRKQPPSNLRFRQRIRIPAAFDPAPILYPAVLPVLISISLFSALPRALLPNILLALAALPPQLVPYGTSPAGYSSVHWLISILPLIAPEITEFPSKLLSPLPYKLKLSPPDQGLHPELLVCLFPLHQALLPPLHYLTTTSLLPAELHLLSIGLIDLLLFTDSPQAGILRTLIWIGGLTLFVLCGKVLKWGVALARIPRWRFRRVSRVIQAQQSFLQVLNKSLRTRSATRAASDSDADEDEPLLQNPLTKTKSLKLDILNALRNNNRTPNGNESRSAIEPNKTEYKHLDRQKSPPPPAATSRRRNTVPSLPVQLPILPNGFRQRRRTKSIAQHFLALTPTQALYRKWIYAAYFYFAVAALILGPIRLIIGKHALYDHEPFGWALGYLFGNIQRLRFEVFDWDLGWWIALPPLFDADDAQWAHRLPLAETFRQTILGPANVRLLLCAYCVSIILVGLVVVFRLSSVVEVDTRRKVFHGMMVAMLLPTIFIDPCFVALALALVLAIFLLLDLIRASQLPPLSGPIATFLTPYVDGRDLRGPVVVSHIFLLIGSAIPLWLSLAGVDRKGEEPWVGWDIEKRDISMVAGVVCVGMGDAAASLIGRRYGRRKWPWGGGKSLEGSLAFAVAVTIGLVAGKIWLLVGWRDGAPEGGVLEWALEGVKMVGKASVCAAGASLEEAVLTGGNDNVVVPVVLWVLVRGVNL